MKAVSILILLSFLGMAVFGFFGMTGAVHPDDCFISLIQKSLCLSQGVFEGADAYAAFGNVIFSGIVLLSIVFLCLLFVRSPVPAWSRCEEARGNENRLFVYPLREFLALFVRSPGAR